MKKESVAIYCRYSGIQIGCLEYMTVAGHLPYISHWDKMQALHPLFSLSKHKLLSFARAEWKRLGKRALDNEVSEHEEQILRVCFLAMLHSLESVDQQLPGLPEMHTVAANIEKLFSLAYWQMYLGSKRFAYPEYRVSKLNANSNFQYVGDYLSVCFHVKTAYESGISEAEEALRVTAADNALKALRNSWIQPVSNKQLWRWIRSYLPAKYEADAQGWIATIFLGNENAILKFDKDEIQLMAEIIETECPQGTGIMPAVRARLDEILTVYTDNKEAFDVDFSDYAPTEDKPALVQPLRKNFASMADFIRANAAFYLQSRALPAAPAVKRLPAEDAPF